MALFKQGDRCKTVGDTMNMPTKGRVVTVRKSFIENGIIKYIVFFEDGMSNYRIEGSPGYILREHEMELVGSFDDFPYETDE